MAAFLPAFERAAPGMDRSFAVRLEPHKVHIMNEAAWSKLFKVARQWLVHYLQNRQLPLEAGLVKMVCNDFEQAVVIMLTYARGHPVQSVQRNMATSLMDWPGPPIDGLARFGDWASLVWVRALNRHLQRRFACGDCFEQSANTACETSRAVYGMLGHVDVLQESVDFLPGLLSSVPALQPLTDCDHVWQVLAVNGAQLDRIVECGKLLGTVSRSGLPLSVECLDFVVDFLAGEPDRLPSHCRSCGQAAKTYCKCDQCLAVFCASCISNSKARKHNHEQALSLVTEVEALQHAELAKEVHVCHQSVSRATFYVRELMASNAERAEWLEFEMQQRSFDESDLPEVAKLFVKFMCKVAPSNQKRTALTIFGIMSGVDMAAQGSIRPYSLQEAFARAWDPSLRMCHDCGGLLLEGKCLNSKCRSSFTCKTCGISEFMAYGLRLKTFMCKNGHYVGWRWRIEAAPSFGRHDFCELAGAKYSAQPLERKRAVQKPR